MTPEHKGKEVVYKECRRSNGSSHKYYFFNSCNQNSIYNPE
uniref:Uncharacterized protein n=1 Tax=Arundo donax TaxID=35708 RepID=A0A0A9BLY9_ARUDO